MPKKEKKTAKPQPKKAAKKAKPAAKKKAATARPAAARTRATAATPARVLTRRRGKTTEVVGLIGSATNEEIALKAYYIAERRHHLGLPGSTESDWLEAERQLRR
jgi:hypothetical protein